MDASVLLSDPWYQFIICYLQDYLHVWHRERIQGSLVALSPETCIIAFAMPLKLRDLIVHICYIYAPDLSGRQSLAFVNPAIERFAIFIRYSLLEEMLFGKKKKKRS